LGLGLLCLAGCGLADYEARMAESQKRLQRTEEENAVLDEPLVMPTEVKDGVSLPLGNVFLRPPRGINKDSNNEAREQFFYAYPLRPTAAQPFSKMEIAFGPKNVEQDFGEVMFGYFQRLGKMDRKQPFQPPGRTLQFDVVEVELGQDRYVSVNVPRGIARSMALIYYYKIPANQKGSIQRVIQISLSTFGSDADVLKQQMAYQQGLRWTAPR
jgi:hypothetical protein